jgi:hypothetical protein
LAKLTLPAPARCIKVLLAMVPTLPLPPAFDGEDNARSTHANSSPTALAHTIFRALKDRALLVRPLPAGPTGGKDGKGDGGNNNGNAGGGGWELDRAADWDGPPPPL